MPDRAVVASDYYWVCDACEAMWDIPEARQARECVCPDCGQPMRRVFWRKQDA